jgi:hypothetical protein
MRSPKESQQIPVTASTTLNISLAIQFPGGQHRLRGGHRRDRLRGGGISEGATEGAK